MSDIWAEPFKLADFFVEPAHNRITRTDNGSASLLEPRVMDLLCALAGADGDVLSRHELLEKVWKNEEATDERLTRAVHELRKALGDTKRPPRFVATVPKRGYKLLQRRTVDLNSPDAAPARQTQKRGSGFFGFLAVSFLIVSASAVYFYVLA